MNDLIVLFFATALILSLFDGISEGLFLRVIDRKARGGSNDRLRKYTDAVEFALPVVGILIGGAIVGLDVSVWDVARGLLVAAFIRWIVRDGVTNLVRRPSQHFFYAGTVADTDVYFSTRNPIINAIIKFSTLIASFVWFIIYI